MTYADKFSPDQQHLLNQGLKQKGKHRRFLDRLRQDLAGLTPRRSPEKIIRVRQQRAWGNHEEG